ncbi:MAG: hypothetical protein NVS3B14_13590 [Ktedonobacteraceae bacterium]
MTFPLRAKMLVSSQLSFTARYYITQPHNIAFGPLQLENIRDRRTVLGTLQVIGGGDTLTVNAS